MKGFLFSFLHTDKEYIWRAYGKMHVILSLGKKQRSRCQLQMIYNKMHFVCHKNLEVKYMACRANDVEEHAEKNLKNGFFFIF